MGEALGRGLLGSLRARVREEIAELAQTNPTLRRARYTLARRLLRFAVVDRSVGQFVGLYLLFLFITLICEWAINRYAPQLLLGYRGAALRDFLKDVSSYLIAAQIGILAIVSVAVAVVTLLSGAGDNPSINTDIRLYYVESYSYELALSGVALLLILTLQLFWPFQHVLHAAGLGGRDYSFKLVLTALHATWFALNLLLFLEFITTTLRFVEPNSREVLRERYSANEVIPLDVRKRLLRAFYLSATSQMFGDHALEDGPRMFFGHTFDLDERTTTEITTRFKRPTELVDVWFRPLQWILKRWRNRVQALPPGEKRFGVPRWDYALTVVPSFDSLLDGVENWVVRRGDVPLLPWERFVLRRCFRFAPASARQTNMPTPQNFMEQLVDKLVSQTEKSATTGFRAALDEVIRYHRFILAAQNTKDSTGKPINVAEIGGFFSSPDLDLVFQYQRVFGAAAAKIGDDTFFIDRLSNLATRLIPDDAKNFSQSVLRNVLRLGVQEVGAFENWLTKRAVIGAADADIGASTALTGSDKRAYEVALIGFVGGWETLLQTLILAVGIERRPGIRTDRDQWAVFAQCFTVIQTHLQNTAYFLAAAVWNDDALGADRFRDLLLRWLQPFYSYLQAPYLFASSLFLTPDLFADEWQNIQAEVAKRMRFGHEQVSARQAAGMILWEVHCDVVCISGLVAVYWYATSQQPSETALRAARLTLGRQKLTSEGSDLTITTSKSIFRLLLDCAVRVSLAPRFAEGRHAASLDELARYLTNLASPRMVTGRIYSSFGIAGFDTLRSVLLAAMAANLPTRDDAGVRELIEGMRQDPLFGDYKKVQNFLFAFKQMSQALLTAETDEVFTKASRALSEGLVTELAANRLRGILDGITSALEELTTERLRTAPLDEEKMEAVRRHVTNEILASGPNVACFANFSIERDTAGKIPTTQTDFGEISRGSFVRPEMSSINFEELPPLFSHVFRDYVRNLLWHGIFHRPKRLIPVGPSDDVSIFWVAVISEAPNVGPEPIVLVPYDTYGEAISAALITGSGEVAGIEVKRADDIPSGGGPAYIGTIDGVHVYSWSVTDAAILCSRHLLRGIKYGTVHGETDIVDFWFLEGDDPEKSRVGIKCAQHFDWADHEVVQFDLSEAVAQ
ncbi:MAG TPA: hypothetical protein VMA30_21630 [Xanthobacteraceae bacterium]|nr:hypothetical protein [Xanthobacteraceae bacterium]